MYLIHVSWVFQWRIRCVLITDIRFYTSISIHTLKSGWWQGYFRVCLQTKRIWKAWTSYFTPLNSRRPSGLILNSCTPVHHITKLLKIWKFTYFEGHTVLRDEFLRHWKFFHWKIWTLSFPTPCRMSSYDS